MTQKLTPISPHALLTEAVQAEKEQFLVLAESFYRQQERTEAQCLQLSQDIVATVERMLAAGDWQTSQFMRNLAEPLRELMTKAQDTAAQLQRARQAQAHPVTALQPDECHVYISLYQAEGHDLKKWEAQLRSIDAYLVGRPIYKHEEEIRSMIRQKLVGVSEAYAVAVVPKRAIMDNSFTAKKTDRLGFELLTVEPTALGPDNVIAFVHLNKRYYFSRQRLQAVDAE